MKKITILALMVLMTLGAMAQKQGYYLAYVVPTQTTPVQNYIKAYSFVMVANDTTLYLTKVAIPIGRTVLNTMKASAANYAIINRAIFGGKDPTYFVDTVSAQNIYGVKAFKNNASFAGTMGVAGNFAVNTNKFTVAAIDGTTTVAGALNSTGTFKVNTNKFIVLAASGNTTVAGNLSVAGTSEFTGASSFIGKVTGSDTVQGNVLKSVSHMLSTGDFKVNTNKFVVTATSGNTTVAGTLGVTGIATFTARPVMSTGLTLTAETDTTTKVAGRIVYIGGNFYGGNGTYYYKLTNIVNN